MESIEMCAFAVEGLTLLQRNFVSLSAPSSIMDETDKAASAANPRQSWFLCYLITESSSPRYTFCEATASRTYY
jgi:hypothetical protein